MLKTLAVSHPSQPTLRDNMGLYDSPRVKLVIETLEQAMKKGLSGKALAEAILPVMLMNYGKIEFETAEKFFGQNIQSILDVGTGFGPAGLFFGSKGHSVLGLDIQDDMIHTAKKVAEACDAGEDVRFLKQDILNFNPTTLFDCFLSVLCLLHIPEKEKLGEKLASVLTTGGKGYIADFYKKTDDHVVDHLLKTQVACPSLFTAEAYQNQLAPFFDVHFEDVTADYSVFVKQRLELYQQKPVEQQIPQVLNFFVVMNTLFGNGVPENAQIGGCRIYLTKI